MPLWLMKFLPDFVICQDRKLAEKSHRCFSLETPLPQLEMESVKFLQFQKLKHLTYIWASHRNMATMDSLILILWFRGCKINWLVGNQVSSQSQEGGFLCNQSKNQSQILLFKVLYCQSEPVKELAKPTGILYGDQHWTKRNCTCLSITKSQCLKSGGLGLVEVKPRNLSLLAKTNWRLLNEDKSLGPEP